jgi:AcrR family transcriptional regulator
MAERMRSDALRSRRRIVEAATALIAEQDPDVSMDAIARSAEVGSATLYRHFPSRAAVLEQLFADRTTVLGDPARDLAGSCEPQDALRRWLLRLARDAVERRGLAAAALADAGGPPPPRPATSGSRPPPGRWSGRRDQRPRGSGGAVRRTAAMPSDPRGWPT